MRKLFRPRSLALLYEYGADTVERNLISRYFGRKKPVREVWQQPASI